MESVSPARVRTALCDQEGFYPFRSLMTGHLSSMEELAAAERFARAVVLHDAIEMEGEPMPSHADEHEWTGQEIAAGRRNVIVAFMPDLRPYGDLFVDNIGPDPLQGQQFEMSASLKELAREMSGGASGDPYYDAHERYLYKLTRTLRGGASIVCGGAVGSALRKTTSRYPEQLFATLDADLQEFAREAQASHVGVVVPPILSVVVSRSQSREEILKRLTELRDEWSEPRGHIWRLVDDLRTCSELRHMRQIQKELEYVSAVFSPARAAVQIEPSRVLWDLVSNAVGIGTAVSSGSGVAEGLAVARAAIAVAKELTPAAKYIFGWGAIDFARRVRSEVMAASSVPEALDRFLTDDERRALKGD